MARKTFLRLKTAEGEEIGIVTAIRSFQSPGHTELTLSVEPHYDGMKRIEKAALEGVIVVDGLALPEKTNTS